MRSSKPSTKTKLKRWRDNGFSDWGGYMAAKKHKLELQFEKNKAEAGSEISSAIFKNVAIFVNGYTDPPSDALKRIMMCNGGIYHQYKQNSTTHIIASNLASVKIKNGGVDKVVSPKWITDSLEEKRLLDYKKYLLYDGSAGNQKLQWANRPYPEEFKCNKREKYLTENSLRGPIEPQTTSTKDSNFLSEFYNHSRLHLISTMGSLFKKYVSELDNHEFLGLQALLSKYPTHSIPTQIYSEQRTVIMHIDMDCFFVSVGLRDKPELTGKPVAVAHSKSVSLQTNRSGRDIQAELKWYKNKKKSKLKNSDTSEDDCDVNNVSKHHKVSLDEFGSTSEIASCNYAARQFGVKNGMFLGLAYQLCPNLVVIPYEFEAYKEVAFHLYDTVASFTTLIEAVSCDEMYVDITDVLRKCRISPIEFADHLRAIIKEKTNCTASAGLGPNMLMARMATKIAKPDGSHYVPDEEVELFILAQKAAELPGVGSRTQEKLESLSVETCQDLQKLSKGTLHREFGVKMGDMMYNFSRGIDTRGLKTEHDRRSVSAEVNYGIRFDNFKDADKFLKELSEEVCRRLRGCNRMAKCFTLKLKIRAKDAPLEPIKFMGHGACDNLTRSVNLTEMTWDSGVVYLNMISVLKQMNVPSCDIRGIGIQGTKLEAPSRSKTRSIVSLLKATRPTEAGNEALGTPVQETGSEDAEIPVPDIQSDVPPCLDCRPSTPRGIAAPPADPVLKPPSADFDVNVWEELPLEVKRLIISEYENIPVQKTPAVTPATVQRDLETEPASFSQIDESFLRALPEDLKAELEQDFHSRENAKLIAAAKKSPIIKKKRPGPQGKRSPLKNAAKNNMIISSDLRLKDPRIRAVEEVQNNVPGKVERRAEPSLNGATRILEVKSQLSAWVQSTDSPIQDDVDTLNEYLSDVISYKNLELVAAALRHFRRLIFPGGSDVWRGVYVVVLEGVQRNMKLHYNGELLLDTDVSPVLD